MIETKEELNKRLLQRAGTTVEGYQRYRLVFADSEFEKRESNFRDLYQNVTLIRDVVEVREVPKYPTAKGCYVLEQFVGRTKDTGLKNHNGYEPVWVFEKDGKPLDPVWFAIEYLIKRLETPIEKLTQEQMDKLESEEETKEYLRAMEALGINPDEFNEEI